MAEIKSNYNPKETEDKTKEEKKIVAVAKGRKGNRSLLDRAFRIFISEDLTGTRNPSILGVIIPQVKKTVLEVIDVFLHPDGKRTYRSGSSASVISWRTPYDSMYRNDDVPLKDNKSYTASVLDYDLVEFDSAGEAEKILQAMEEIISHFGIISIADYYDLCGIDDASYTTNKYGWHSLTSARVVRIGTNRYKLKLPKAMPLMD